MKLILLAVTLSCVDAFAGREPGAALAAFEQARGVPAGAKISIRNSYGRITVTGWDSDTIEAIATRADGNTPINVSITEGANRKSLLITPEIHGGGNEAFHLEVKVPRNVVIDSVDAIASSVTVASVNNAVTVNTESGQVSLDGVQGPVTITTVAGDIKASNVGPLKATTQRGEISVDDVNGSVTLQAARSNVITKKIRGNIVAKITEGSLRIQETEGSVDVAMTGGGIEVNDVGRIVRVATISGSIEIECVRGDAEVNSVSGNIVLSHIGGDVDLTAASGEVRLTGEIRPEGRYRLKSHSGNILMATRPGGSGFSATLSSYSGEIHTDFELEIESPPQPGSSVRRVIGRFGGGQAQILLDSFSGKVSLMKHASPQNNNCGR